MFTKVLTRSGLGVMLGGVLLSATPAVADLSSYDAVVESENGGGLPYAAVSREILEFDTTTGAEFDFGEVSGSATLEFIVSGDPEAAQNGYLAVGENGTWNLRYEQWSDTSALGFTHLGVADYLFSPVAGADPALLDSPTEPVHLAYRWDQENTTMELYVNGVLVGRNEEATDYEMPTGLGFLGAKDAAGTEGMSGVIERVTVYDKALDPGEILFHAEAWLGNSDPGLVVSRVYDFGELPFIATPQEVVLPLRNSGQENDLEVEVKVAPGGNFTLVSAPDTIAPGTTGEVRLLFDRLGAIGAFTGSVEILTNDPDAFDQAVTVTLLAALVDREGPVAHYRMDEAAGTVVMPDATGSGRDGVYGEGLVLGGEGLAGGTSVEAEGGAAASIPGDRFAEISFEAFTLSLWVRAESSAGLQTLIAKGGDNSPTFAVLANEGALQWFVDAGPEFGTAGPVLSAGVVHHVAVTYTREMARLYLDGQVVAEQADPLAFEVETDNPMLMGSFNGALPFTGQLDDVQIYDRALTEAQVAGLHQLPGSVVTGALSSRPPVAARWSFDGHLSDTAPGGVGDVLLASGTPEYVPGVVGQAVRFSSEGLQRLWAADSQDVELADSWTLEAFVRPDAGNTGVQEHFWGKWGDGSNDWQWSFLGAEGDPVANGLHFRIGEEATVVVDGAQTTGVPLDNWSHVALVGDAAAGTVTAWLNGMQVGSAPFQAVPAGDGAMSFGRDAGGENPYFGLVDEALIHAVAKDGAYLAERAALIEVPRFYPIVGITSSTEIDDFYPVNNLIQGPEVGFAAAAPHRRLLGGPEGLWVTAAPGGFPSDYIEAAGAPVLVLDLGDDVLLAEISVWGYAAANANGVSTFSLRFATEAEGSEGFGQSIGYAPTFHPSNDEGRRQSFFFEQPVRARYVEFTAEDNFFMEPGDGSGGETPGGDRVGLGEIAFEIDPSTGGAGAPDSGGAVRDALGWVTGSGGPLTAPTVVDFGPLTGDATYEFSFNALKGGASTAVAGNTTWALKLDQWNEQGIFGATEFGVADHVFDDVQGGSAASVFDRDVHVVIVNDVTAGETRLYIDGVAAGVWAGTFELAGEVSVMAAQLGVVDPMGEGSVMYGWSTYDDVLTAENIAVLATTPFGSDGEGGGGGEGTRWTRLSEVMVTSDGVFQVTLPDGVTAVIEYSVDLENWEVIATDASGVVTDDDPARGGQAQGFYRARQP